MQGMIVGGPPHLNKAGDRVNPLIGTGAYLLMHQVAMVTDNYGIERVNTSSTCLVYNSYVVMID